MSSKYKEFWISDCKYVPNRAFESKEGAHCRVNGEDCDKQIFHTIEHAAYLELKGKLDKVLEALKDVIRNSSDIVAKKRCSIALYEID